MLPQVAVSRQQVNLLFWVKPTWNVSHSVFISVSFYLQVLATSPAALAQRRLAEQSRAEQSRAEHSRAMSWPSRSPSPCAQWKYTLTVMRLVFPTRRSSRSLHTVRGGCCACERARATPQDPQGQPAECESVFQADLAVCLGATSKPKSPLPRE